MITNVIYNKNKHKFTLYLIHEKKEEFCVFRYFFTSFKKKAIIRFSKMFLKFVKKNMDGETKKQNKTIYL